jgi:hypothetical protein
MAAEGIAYVPAACSTNISGCILHVNYHGCIFNAPGAVSVVAHNAGFCEWAESNAIVVVFPAVNASLNYGCWEWDGSVVGEFFDTKLGGQLQTVVSMLTNLQESIIGPAPIPPGGAHCQLWEVKTLLVNSCAPWTSPEECDACALAHADIFARTKCSDNVTTRRVGALCSAPDLLDNMN